MLISAALFEQALPGCSDVVCKAFLFAVLFLRIILALLSFPSVSPFSCVFLAVSPVDLCFFSVPSISFQIHDIPLELLCIHVGLPYCLFFFFNA